MANIEMRKVKCCKCNKESEQKVILSISYFNSTKKEIKELLNRKQKCPFCNYEAFDISEDENNTSQKDEYYTT